MTDHEALEALIREIAERQKKEPEIPWFVHAREIVRTGQLIPAPSVDDAIVERVARAINHVRFEDDGSSPCQDDYDMANAAISAMQVKL